MNTTRILSLVLVTVLAAAALQADFISIADFDSSGFVDFKDYAFFADNWLRGDSAADITVIASGYNVVDAGDVRAFTDRWLYSDELMAYWKLDETEGDIAYDTAGDHDATLSGEPAWIPTGGKMDGALQFDGLDDYVETDFILNPAEGAFRVTLWARGGEPNQVIISQQPDQTDGPIWLGADPEGHLMTAWVDDQGQTDTLTAEASITDSLWHQIKLEWDGKRRALYIDDQEVARDQNARGKIKDFFTGLQIGTGPTRAANTFWTGTLDEIRIFDLADRVSEVDLLAPAKQAQEAHTDELMAIDGVIGTAVGFNADRQPAIKVLAVDANVIGIPNELDSIQVETLITGDIYALTPIDVLDKPNDVNVDPTLRFDRPVPIGVSTGHTDITAGTIGCRVKDPSGNVFALSNNHIFAKINLAEIGDPVLQPGPYDGGTTPDDRIGTLADFEPLNFAVLPPNTMDAAVALSSPEQLGNSTPPDGYGTPKSRPMKAHVHFKVQKYGRTTKLTEGAIEAVNATVSVVYRNPDFDPENPDGTIPLYTAIFVNQILVTPGETFVQGGDSGSLVVSRGKKPIGLVFAGGAAHGIVCPIEPILERFNVTIDGK